MTQLDRAEPNDDVLATASDALFRLGRAFGRQPSRDALLAEGEPAPDLSAILLVQAIAAAERRGEEVTVGVVAVELGIDPSTASRLVAQCEARGYLTRCTSLRDGRASVLTRSARGVELEQAAAAYQRRVFAMATQGWSEEERQEFAARFAAFAGAIIAALRVERQAESPSSRELETRHAIAAQERQPLA